MKSIVNEVHSYFVVGNILNFGGSQRRICNVFTCGDQQDCIATSLPGTCEGVKFIDMEGRTWCGIPNDFTLMKSLGDDPLISREYQP